MKIEIDDSQIRELMKETKELKDKINKTLGKMELLFGLGYKFMDHDKCCVKCGTRKNLGEYTDAYFRISEKSDPNVMRFRDCYVCVECKKLALKLIKVN